MTSRARRAASVSRSRRTEALVFLEELEGLPQDVEEDEA